jgi:hypothetical protein
MARYGEFIPPVRAEIRRLGGAIDRERKGRHFVIYWSIGAEKFLTIVPLTSCNFHMLDNVLSHVRQCARKAAA